LCGQKVKNADKSMASRRGWDDKLTTTYCIEIKFNR
jgi:hypothetical protein